MRYFNLLIFVSLVGLAFSCKKNEIPVHSSGSIVIVNAILNGKAVKFGSNTTVISNNSYAYYNLPTGSPEIYLWPVGDSLNPYYTSNKDFVIEQGDIYSLYLAGSIASPNAILVKEFIPIRNDSTAGIRFINLSQYPSSLNITLASSPGTDELSSLSYKGITEFKSYPALYNSTYTFQIRDVSTKEILTTYSFQPSTIPRFANVTLVIRGQSGSIGVSRVNNDR